MLDIGDFVIACPVEHLMITNAYPYTGSGKRIGLTASTVRFYNIGCFYTRGYDCLLPACGAVMLLTCMEGNRLWHELKARIVGQAIIMTILEYSTHVLANVRPLDLLPSPLSFQHDSPFSIQTQSYKNLRTQGEVILIELASMDTDENAGSSGTEKLDQNNAAREVSFEAIINCFPKTYRGYLAPGQSHGLLRCLPVLRSIVRVQSV